MSECRIGYLACCGIKEAVGVDNEFAKFSPAAFVRSVRNQKGGSPFIIFSSITGNGKELADYIEKNKLGDITTLPSRINLNSSNRLQAWLWRPGKTDVVKAAAKRIARKVRRKV